MPTRNTRNEGCTLRNHSATFPVRTISWELLNLAIQSLTSPLIFLFLTVSFAGVDDSSRLALELAGCRCCWDAAATAEAATGWISFAEADVFTFFGSTVSIFFFSFFTGTSGLGLTGAFTSRNNDVMLESFELK